ncbi:MAG TPA: FecR family protein [Gammaproteobacteria bacterium]|nr:FecR family protein [Gammaproteobacteria bacterium]
MRIRLPAVLTALLVVVACGRSNPPPAPAVSTAAPPVAASAPAAVPAVSTTPAASSAPGAATAAEAEPAGPESAGDVVLAQGSVTDTGADGKSRPLQDGDTVYPGDSFVLGDDSYLDVDFEDGGRILLRPDTTFQIQQYHFDPAAHPATGAEPAPEPLATAPPPENSFFKLVKGGLRAVDGLIGHSHPENYGIETPVATIGVRGTAFDVRYCGDDCKDEADASGAPDNGLYTSVSEGAIGVKNDTGETVTPAGHAAFVKSRREHLRALAAPPKALRHMQLPEKLKARDDSMRAKVHVRQQQRRRQIIERRQRQAAQQKLHGGPATSATGKNAGTPEAGGRREERLEKRGAMTPAEKRQQRLERREGKVAGEPAGSARAGAAAKTPAERRQERREGQRAGGGKRAEPTAHKPSEAAPGKTPGGKGAQQKAKTKQDETATPPKAQKGKPDQGSQDKCKDDKKKKKDKNKKDKCDGD